MTTQQTKTVIINRSRDVKNHFLKNKIFYALVSFALTSGTTLNEMVSIMTDISVKVANVEVELSEMDKHVIKQNDLLAITQHLRTSKKGLSDLTNDEIETIFMTNDWKETIQ